MPYKYFAFFNGVTRLEDKGALDKNSLIIILCTYESIIGLKILLEQVEKWTYIIFCYLLELHLTEW